MIYEILSVLLGSLKILLFKIINVKRIYFKKLPKMNSTFKIAIKQGSQLRLGQRLRCRNNVSFRIYNNGKVIIGDDCFFNDGCSINCNSNITIGNKLICGQNVMFFDHDHDYKNNIENFICDDIIVGDNVWIGANCTILKGSKIGNNVVIASGSVIRENIEDNMLVYQEKKLIKRKY